MHNVQIITLANPNQIKMLAGTKAHYKPVHLNSSHHSIDQLLKLSGKRVHMLLELAWVLHPIGHCLVEPHGQT